MPRAGSASRCVTSREPRRSLSSTEAPSRISSRRLATSSWTGACGTASSSPIRARSSRSARRSTPRRRASRLAPLGRAALLLSLGLVLYAVVAGAIGAHRRRRRLSLSARNALYAAFGTTAVAALVLLAALARRDFSFTYVAEHTNRNLAGGYALSAFWGGQEGSLLLWLLILTGYAAVAVRLAGPS